jgi:hypothetical protein
MIDISGPCWHKSHDWTYTPLPPHFLLLSTFLFNPLSHASSHSQTIHLIPLSLQKRAISHSPLSHSKSALYPILYNTNDDGWKRRLGFESKLELLSKYPKTTSTSQSHILFSLFPSSTNYHSLGYVFLHSSISRSSQNYFLHPSYKQKFIFQIRYITNIFNL